MVNSTMVPISFSQGSHTSTQFANFEGSPKNPSGSIHPFILESSLQLVTWLVSRAREFGKTLEISFSTLQQKEQSRIPNQPGRSGICGAVDGVPFHVQ